MTTDLIQPRTIRYPSVSSMATGSISILGSLAYVLTYYGVSSEVILYLTILILSVSYMTLVVKYDITVLLILIIYSRVIVGYSASGNNSVYNILNFLVNYLPFILCLKTPNFRLNIKRKYTIIYVFCMFLSVLLVSSWSTPTFIKRFIPMLFFVCMAHNKITINPKVFLFVFFNLGLATIFVFLTTEYNAISLDLLGSGMVFKTKSEFIPSLADLVRVMGPFYDPRIFGLFLNISLVYAFRYAEKGLIRSLTIVLSLLLLGLSLSRGGILTGLIIVIYHYYKVARMRLLIGLSGIALFSGLVFFDELLDLYDAIFNFGGNNPIQQRSGFIVTGLKMFISRPWGHGLGYLTNLTEGVVVGSATYYYITDAFYSIQLVELGIIGFIAFILSTVEIFFYKKDQYLKVFSVGLIIQMIGTDIPDFAMYYLLFLMIIVRLNSINLSNTMC
jgi:hypothetical protein